MAKSRRRNKGGRPRKEGPRTPSGQLSRAGQSIIPPEVIAQRARQAPGVSEKTLRVEGGTPLSILRLRGDITTTQMDAGEKLGRLWRRWSAAACAPPRWPVITESSLSVADITEEEWQRLDRDMDGALAAIQDCPQCKLVYSMLESVCVEEVMPPYLDPSHTMRPLLLSALCIGLDAMATFFRIAGERAA